MGYPKYNEEGCCPKCSFPYSQIFRKYYDEEHTLMIDKDLVKCKVKGEHLHMECACGYEMIVRPLDWKNDTNKTTRKRKTQKV